MNYTERNAKPALDIIKLTNKISKYEMEMIVSIAYRAAKVADELGDSYKVTTCIMDLCVWHAQSPIILHELMAAGNGDFNHDVFGIRANIDRRTGELLNCFMPRYSLPEPRAAITPTD